MGHDVLNPPVDGTRAPRLLDQVRDAIRTKHYSFRTEKAYVGWIRRFIVFNGTRHPAELGSAEVARYLQHLAVRGRVAASTQNQAFSAHLPLRRGPPPEARRAGNGGSRQEAAAGAGGALSE